MMYKYLECMQVGQNMFILDMSKYVIISPLRGYNYMPLTHRP